MTTEIISKQIDNLRSVCLNDKYSDETLNTISVLLSEMIDKLNWITLAERMIQICLKEEQYKELLEYKHIYENRGKYEFN